jgi:toxin-antitoxin system PIN domain toxin
MRALLDVNVLIALLDAGHLHHRLAMNWLSTHIDQGWASCPLTQNGCIRIFSHAAYPNAVPAFQIAERLRKRLNTTPNAHVFWPDSISLLGPRRLAWDRLLSSRQVTDAYLLALVVEHGGRFVTLDRGIPVAAVRDAESQHLVVLPSS